MRSIEFLINLRLGGSYYDVEIMRFSAETYMRRRFAPAIVTFMSLIVVTTAAACSDKRLAGKSAADYFKTPKVAALAEAAVNDDLDKMEALAAEGVDVNAKGADGIHLFFWVFATSSKEAFAKLYQLGANPLQEAKRRKTVAFDATGVDDPGYLEILLEGGLDPNATKPSKPNETLLMQAIFYHRWPQVELLLKHCADINWASEFGASAATNAVVAAQLDMLVRFLDEGYSYDLQGLAFDLDGRIIASGHEQHSWKLKAVQLLKDKGISFPAERPQPPAPPSAEPVYAKSCLERQQKP